LLHIITIYCVCHYIILITYCHQVRQKSKSKTTRLRRVCAAGGGGGRELRGKGEKCEVDNRYAAAPLHTSPPADTYIINSSGAHSFAHARIAPLKTRPDHESRVDTLPESHSVSCADRHQTSGSLSHSPVQPVDRIFFFLPRHNTKAHR